METKKTAAIITLGCRLNQADSALITSRLRKMNFEIVSADSSSSPNLIFVNSCAVTAIASKKSRQALKAIREENPQSFIVMIGCSANVDSKQLEKMGECDLILTNEQKKDIEKILPRYLADLKVEKSPAIKKSTDKNIFFEHADSAFPFKSRAILKIQEGCENFCSYCIVPFSRGKERSRDLEETVADFQQLVQSGFHEIVLSGVNICNYRCKKYNLTDLIERLLEIPGDYRIRLSSTEPSEIVPDLIHCIAAHPDKICRFLHLPAQHCCDAVLKAMKRRYSVADYLAMVKMAKENIPDIHLGTDLIVGFPGETDDFFQESCDNIRKVGFANIHIFPFSPRPGTEAEKMTDRPTGEILEQRLETMRTIKAESADNFIHSLYGHSEMVLVETKNENGICEGWSGNYVKTRFHGDNVPPRTLVKVKFKKKLTDGTVAAEL